MHNRATRALAASVVAVIAAACSNGTEQTASHTQALVAARNFLSSYVDASGRAIRKDQGGDVVSEGQSYAMLLAVATGDRRRFDSVWSWTRSHLQQPSGLLAYHWQRGTIADRMPSSDADLLAAWALDLGGRRFNEPGLQREAAQLASAISSHEVLRLSNGQPVLVAGPWALHSSIGSVVEPGYWASPAELALGKLTGAPVWAQLAVTHAGLSSSGSGLPPDWAVVRSPDSLQPVGAPDGSGTAASGQDGLRALVWSSCSGGQATKRWWSLVQPTASQAPLSRHLDGQPLQRDQSPLSAVAAAAVAQAAGDTAQSTQLLDEASSIEQRYPTYYGSAWVALGRVLLETDLLTSCG